MLERETGDAILFARVNSTGDAALLDGYSHTIEERLQKVRAIWKDESAFAHVVESGRFLKLCEVTCALEEALESADPNASNIKSGNEGDRLPSQH